MSLPRAHCFEPNPAGGSRLGERLARPTGPPRRGPRGGRSGRGPAAPRVRPWGRAAAWRSMSAGVKASVRSPHATATGSARRRSGRRRRGPSPCGTSRPRPRAGTAAARCRRAGPRTRSRRRRAARRARARRTAAWPRSWRTPRRGTRTRSRRRRAPWLRGFVHGAQRRVDGHHHGLVAVQRAEAPGLGRLGEQQRGAARRVPERERAVEAEAVRHRERVVGEPVPVVVEPVGHRCLAVAALVERVAVEALGQPRRRAARRRGRGSRWRGRGAGAGRRRPGRTRPPPPRRSTGSGAPADVSVSTVAAGVLVDLGDDALDELVVEQPGPVGDHAGEQAARHEADALDPTAGARPRRRARRRTAPTTARLARYLRTSPAARPTRRAAVSTSGSGGVRAKRRWARPRSAPVRRPSRGTRTGGCRGHDRSAGAPSGGPGTCDFLSASGGED